MKSANIALLQSSLSIFVDGPKVAQISAIIGELPDTEVANISIHANTLAAKYDK